MFIKLFDQQKDFYALLLEHWNLSWCSFFPFRKFIFIISKQMKYN